MKFQYLAVIFIIIILPISLVLGFYMQAQIDIINRQTDYTTKLTNATHDALKAFQINTTNSYYSSVSDSKIRDIEASVNTFYNSLTASLHYSKDELQSYVPAIVYTLYDGYYIYGKRYNVYEEGSIDLNSSGELLGMEITRNDGTTNIENETNPDLYEYGLRPFVYYSCRYQKDSNNDFVINFTLDNFISIYGTINGHYETRSGYLVSTREENWEVDRDLSRRVGEQVTRVRKYKGANIGATEQLTEYLRFANESTAGVPNGEYEYVVYRNQKIYKNGGTYFWYDQGEAHIIQDQNIKNAVNQHTKSAEEYYRSALNFSEWVTANIGDISQGNIRTVKTNSEGQSQLVPGGSDLEFNAGDNKIFNMYQVQNDPEDESSIFNQHRIAVIKNTIVTNLITAINSYNSNASSFAYALPQLVEEDWQRVVNNVCIIAFMQGLPMGGKYFNNYTVIPNDKNNEFVDTDSIYLLGDDGQYHLPNCPDLINGSVSIENGYANISFEKQTVNEHYYYKHVKNGDEKQPYTACYHCIVNAIGEYDLQHILDATNNRIGGRDITTLRSKYLTILARERYNLYKTNN